MPVSRNGFTLMEAVLALVIFSLMATGFLFYTKRQADEIQYLTDKTLASVVASNLMNGMRSGQGLSGGPLTLSVSAETLKASQWPDTGKSLHTLAMGRNQWDAYVDVEDTPYADLRRVDISVSRRDAAYGTGVLARLTGFVGKY